MPSRSSATVSPAPTARRLAALSELVSAVGLIGMIGGQYRDVRPAEALDAAGLERTSRLKTGALLGAAAACGAIVGGAEADEIDTARAFGVELGLLFQIVDDVLDETGDDDALGKPAGSDARRGRRTFASELGLHGARKRAAESEQAARAPGAPPRPPTPRWRRWSACSHPRPLAAGPGPIARPLGQPGARSLESGGRGRPHPVTRACSATRASIVSSARRAAGSPCRAHAAENPAQPSAVQGLCRCGITRCQVRHGRGGRRAAYPVADAQNRPIVARVARCRIRAGPDRRDGTRLC